MARRSCARKQFCHWCMPLLRAGARVPAARFARRGAGVRAREQRACLGSAHPRKLVLRPSAPEVVRSCLRNRPKGTAPAWTRQAQDKGCD